MVTCVLFLGYCAKRFLTFGFDMIPTQLNPDLQVQPYREISKIRLFKKMSHKTRDQTPRGTVPP